MISTLLESIKSGKRVKLASAVSSLEKEGVSRHYTLNNLTFKHISSGQYIILSISDELRDIIKRLDVDSTSRCSLATQNKSHNISVGNAFALLKKEATHPVVVTFDSNGYVLDNFELSGSLVIIENFKNFSMSLESLEFLRQHCNFADESEIDIAYGSGRNASNRLMKSFYDRYSRIYLFLDMDLGGLEIAKSIIELTDTPCEFIMPLNIDMYLSNVVVQTSDKKLERIYEIAAKRPELVKAANAMIKHRKEFEQEGYLHGY